MSFTISRFQPTPNPNAVKCILDRRASDRPRSFFDAAQARGHPIADPLFAIDGVTNVLIGGDWITVNKRPDAEWATLKAAIRRVLLDAR